MFCGVRPIISLRLGADRFDAVVLGVESDDRRLVQDDASSGDEDAGVGRAEIDGEIGREAEDITEKHWRSEVRGRSGLYTGTPEM